MGKGNSSKVNEILGFVTLGHSNWTIWSLITGNIRLASHSNPILFTAERGEKEGTGAENGKRAKRTIQK